MKKILKVFLAITVIGLLVLAAPSMAQDKVKDLSKVVEEKGQGKFIEIPPTDAIINSPSDESMIGISASDFKGTWVNTNTSAKGMIKFIITSGTFHGYGSCSPTPCDWGTTPLTLYSTSVSDPNDIAGTAQYNFGFAKQMVTLRMVTPYSIKANHYTQFTDGSGRHNYLEENLVFSYKRLARPRLVSPLNGTEFSHYPRTTKLDWNPVSGAVSYKIQIQYCSPAGCNVWAVNYPIVSTIATDYTFNFVGAQPGRWRVWAIDTNGKESLKSSWWNFRYTI